MEIHTNNKTAKQLAREEIDAQVEQFIKSGGQITTFEYGLRAITNDPEETFNKARKVHAKRQPAANAWSTEEDAILFKAFDEGLRPSDIAHKLPNRTVIAVRSRMTLIKKGVIKRV